ncbi:MAG: DUF1905 domain-containing protein [Bacteroidetes bacterium]|nr:DUF1905 domain-containing protein [Bacteroidota bacterium]
MKSKKAQFSATILKFSRNGEKTGWTYIDIPTDIAQMLKPGNKKSFRVKGFINGYEISFIALMPMGNGNFILPLNAAIRKGIEKREGAIVAVELKEDLSTYQIDQDLIECMEADEKAKSNFYKLPPSHRNYYSKWIESAKTDVTKAKRIVMTLEALSKGKNYAEMLREKK